MRLLITAVLFLFPPLIIAQSDRVALLVDSYDDQIRSSEAEQWHLEDLRDKLLKEPNAKTYIIAYGGREDTPGKANRYALRAKLWLVEWRGVDPARIVAIDGGRREQFVVELWIVPRDAPPPVPSPKVDVQTDLTDNLLYDEFSIGDDNFAGRTESQAVRLEGFAAALKKEPRSWGCVIAFAQAGNDRLGEEWDRPGEAARIARDDRQYLIRRGLPRNRVTAVDGGYAERVIQVWIMRPGASFDQGPFIYSNRLRSTGRGQLVPGPRSSVGLCCKACIRKGTDRYILRDSKSRFK